MRKTICFALLVSGLWNISAQVQSVVLGNGINYHNGVVVNAGAEIDRVTPRERSDAAEGN